MSIEGVNKVQSDGRFKIPEQLAERYEGKHLAVFVDDKGRIVLDPVDIEE